VLRRLTAVATAAAVVLPAAGAARTDAPARFENRVVGHTLRLPPGWQARLKPSDAGTVASTYRPRDLERLDERPPRGGARILLYDYGRVECPRDAAQPGQPIRLGPLSLFSGHGEGYNVHFCRGGHALHARIKIGAATGAGRLEQVVAVLESVRLTRRADEIGNIHSYRLLGRSHDGRPIRSWRIGNARSPKRMLVVGCIHGNECAGMAVTQRLVNLTRPVALDLWVIQNLNPDGLARNSRGNARGVDLNRDFDTFSQRETRIARDLIRRLEPDVTVWFHQPQAVVRAWGPSRAIARRYARLAGEPYRSLPWPPGAATRWQNGLGQKSFVVELAPGELPDARADRHARALLQLQDPLCCTR
jgi:murein peptide amidase A